MHFTTGPFAVFFLVILILNWSLRGRRGYYRIFLLSANLFFYGCFDVRYVPLLLVVGFTNWFFAALIAQSWSESRRKVQLTVNVALNLLLLAFFKYFEFFYGWFEILLANFGMQPPSEMLELIFPIGISFFTFQGIGYAVDVFRNRDAVIKSPLDVLLFISFFPTVMSGPIMRIRYFIPQLDRPFMTTASFQAGYTLLLSGLFKKVVVASYLSEHVVRQVFQVPANYSSFTVLAAVYGYSIQIFCDFSGYSDLAIGLALLMGFYIPENFRQPYRAVNIQEFWRRWHISLSTWLRDYLYIPLGGARRGKISKYINLMITMVLGGLWHGAHARFILWGALHGLGLVLTHIYKDLKKALRPESASAALGFHRPGQVFFKRVSNVICWFLTFNFVSFLWVFFRAKDADRAFEIFRAVFRFDQPGMGFDSWVVAAILTGLVIQFIGPPLYDRFLKIQLRLPWPIQALTAAILAIVIMRLGPEGVLPFIYFQF